MVRYALVLLVTAAVSFMMSYSVSADSRRAPLNAAETFAQADCLAGAAAGAYYSRGVFWANNSNPADTFSQTVNIAYDTTGWVNATLYTGAYACGTITQYNPTTREMASTNTARLQLTGTSLQRDSTHSPNNFTDPMSSMPIRINVTGLSSGDHEFNVTGRLYYATTPGGALIGQLSATNTVRVRVQRALKFDLTPSVSVPSLDLTPGDATITSITPKVVNAGPTDSFPNTYWQLIRFILPSGVTPKAGGVSTTTAPASPPSPCMYYTGVACGGTSKMLSDGNALFRAVPQTVLPSASDNITGLEQGQKVCYAVAVKGYNESHNPASADTDGYRYGTPVCRQVSKKPKLQVWGGDVRTRGKIVTSTSVANGATYGSWVEYGALSVGINTNFASGSGLHGGSTASVSQRHTLTFANIDDHRTSSYGQYALPATPSIATQFTATPTVIAPRASLGAASVAVGDLATGTYDLTATNVTLTGGVLRGTSVVLIAPGTITISGDITYASESGGSVFSTIQALPQLIIIAKNITIEGGVEEVNAWLLAGEAGVINTCSDVEPTANLSSKLCDRPLVVNGPVATNTLYLRRTAGASSVAAADQPAERLNLRSDAYLWAYNHGAQVPGRVQTLQVTELPPRF